MDKLKKNKNIYFVDCEGEYLFVNKKKGRRLSTKGFTVYSKNSKLNYVIISDKGEVSVDFSVNPDELYEFAKLAKKDNEKFKGDIYCKHFNPELSFIFNSKQPPKKKRK